MCFPRLAQLPDLASRCRLAKLSIGTMVQICCNGFLGTCNLTHPPCQAYPGVDIPQASCFTTK